ncbi:hypothetical protein J2Y00_004783 [Deinococcus soli (ex Cha et al. 2016)]|uniref:Uncharacterized protein n=2 Tax=Deinococcus soli (ex Cha et al. 2016) TaxID=1309411 RepID=A0AAE4BQW6_9DEIO|nr:hypothetical protein [Deinococcus soli (ex Cha et al. 2016)]MDR6331084.1 hypothetical protein [Deinococcus soli (ex Cha et al. 2016)]MDR6754280.1 hypothetical protein [Deinococcus soli (ex Cha et al. 2016)]
MLMQTLTSISTTLLGHSTRKDTVKIPLLYPSIRFGGPFLALLWAW